MNSRDALCRVCRSEAVGSSRRHAFAIFTIATLVTLAVLGNGWKAGVGGLAPSTRVTVIYKNQMHPSIGELEAGAREKDHSGDANSQDGLVFQRRSQWI
jgi:hypothetical protein